MNLDLLFWFAPEFVGTGIVLAAWYTVVYLMYLEMASAIADRA